MLQKVEWGKEYFDHLLAFNKHGLLLCPDIDRLLYIHNSSRYYYKTGFQCFNIMLNDLY